MTTEQTTPTPFRHGMRYATSAAIDRLKEGKHGDIITRDEMASTIKESCAFDTPGYRSVCGAIKFAEKQFHVVWRWDRDQQAWRCLDDCQSTKVASQNMLRARSRAKRSLVIASAVDVKKLGDEDRREHSLCVISAGIMATAGSSAFRKRVADKQAIGPNYEQLATLINGTVEVKS